MSSEQNVAMSEQMLRATKAAFAALETTDKNLVGLRYEFSSEKLVACSQELGKQHQLEIEDLRREIKEWETRPDEEVQQIAGFPVANPDGYTEQAPGQPVPPSLDLVRKNTIRVLRKRLAWLEFSYERGRVLENCIPAGKIFTLDVDEAGFVLFGAVMHIQPAQGFRAIGQPQS